MYLYLGFLSAYLYISLCECLCLRSCINDCSHASRASQSHDKSAWNRFEANHTPGHLLSLLRINCGRRTFTFISVTIVSLFSILIFEATGTALQMAMHTLTSSPGFTRGASVTVIAWLGILGIPVQSTAMLRLCGQLQCDDCRPGFSFADSQSQRLFGFIQIRDPEKTLCQLPPVQFLLFFFILLRSMAQLNQWSHCTGKMLGFNLTFWLWLLGGQGWFEGDTP